MLFIIFFQYIFLSDVCDIKNKNLDWQFLWQWKKTHLIGYFDLFFSKHI